MSVVIVWCVAIGVGLPLLGYLAYALWISPEVRTTDSFFLASHSLSSRKLTYTLGATWMSLGNVILALLILAKYYGWVNWWGVATWALGFLIMLGHAPRIHRKVGTAQTIHSFLASRLSAPRFKTVASVITVIAAIGVIALELMVAMALCSVVAPGATGDALAIAIGLFFCLIVALYTALGGLRAVVDTDKWQFFLVSLGVAALLAIAIRYAASKPPVPVDASLYVPSWKMALAPGWPFYVGLFFMQAFLLPADMGTWQRVIATSHDEKHPYRAFGVLAVINSLWWAALIIAGILLSSIPADTPAQHNLGRFAAYASDLIAPLIVALDPSQPSGQITGILLVIPLLWGLGSAMLSTGDSYLLVAMHTLSIDVANLRPSMATHAPSTTPSEAVPGASPGETTSAPPVKHDNGPAPEATCKPMETSGSDEDPSALLSDEQPVKWSRRGIVLASMASFGIAVVCVVSDVEFVSLVVLLFGAQCVLAPVACLCLRDDIDVSHYKSAAFVSLLLGYAAAMSSGLWLLYGAKNPNATLIVPIIAVCVTLFVLMLAMCLKDGIVRAAQMVPCMVGLYPKETRL
jgi:Na+/proline symporter